MPAAAATTRKDAAMTGIIDVWMQHPTPRFMQHDMFDSLRRWTRANQPEAHAGD